MSKAPRPATVGTRAALVDDLQRLRSPLLDLFAQREQTQGRRRLHLQRRLLLGLELLRKLDEQMVLPALQQAVPASGRQISRALRELDVQRDPVGLPPR